MKIGTKVLTSILLGTLASVVAAASSPLPHEDFMPPDRYAARQDRPEQMLLEVDNYRLTIASESRQAGTGRTQESSLWLFIAGRSLLRGSQLDSVRVGFIDGPGSLPPARHEAATQTLTMYYPLSYLDTVRGLLEGPGPHFVQVRFYGNGTVWADIHAGPITVR
ncbi:hypothetical protein DHB74_13630 [Pseudomonas sp. G11-1]|uniref:Copper chaperone PCu(A)C n=1 Tax=Halopseudomonas bauzanensis TaxID=653930 RepID=A0A1I4QEI5_9GAMM|nr:MULTISPECIES: hypothetical protein [Halopseudomonas]MCO5787401.1 hypothetical protein [Pseudomonas sp. G11-1]MCO5790626.1 hypothetical protein [Pseudomonas sp. G11-2]TKA89384.1 hypothetical protein FA869_16795 [Halopseudomonas bauzanensis]WGK62138.1 hypothetical protein QAO71_02550 [Halopseudomonas sp. SMJS2]SES36593.1 hypothetical protein SAMN05216589_0037 [Halopseudomonas bauzanensis]